MQVGGTEEHAVVMIQLEWLHVFQWLAVDADPSLRGSLLNECFFLRESDDGMMTIVEDESRERKRSIATHS